MEPPKKAAKVEPATLAEPEDRSSCANTSEWRVTHYSFQWTVDFAQRSISGVATLTVQRIAPAPAALELDCHEGMAISQVTIDGTDAPFEIRDFCSFGKSLVITLPESAASGKVAVHYRTSGEPAVTWLSPEQTLGNVAPMCFSMGQATLNRALFPCQDTPSVRATFDATFDVRPIGGGVDESSIAVACGAASSGATSVVPTSTSGRAPVRYTMPQSLPSYLIGTFVIGRLGKRPVGPRSSVWAEPELLTAASEEFDGVVETYLRAAEDLFGPYQWDTYDIIMMPKAFAYGGMENPRLTFLSPTLVVGDKSLTDTVAHEIAHSWFGNLVTNASWAQFFLNEGFTMYAQRRITERVNGVAFTALEALVGWRLLEQEIKDQGGCGAFTKLNVPIAHDVDPDDTYNDVPYEKGYALLMYLREVALGGDVDAFDGWLRAYVADHAFSCVTASQMLTHLRRHFADRSGDPLRAASGGPFSDEVAKAWLEGEGLPPDGWAPDQTAAAALTQPAEELAELAAAAPPSGELGAALEAQCAAFCTWPTYQKSYALDQCISGPRFAGGESAVLAFGRACGLHAPCSSNRELSMRWSVLLCKEGLVHSGIADITAHCTSTGKQKFTLPVYRALAKAQPRHLFDEAAAKLFGQCKSFLDVAVARKVEAILEAPVQPAAPVAGMAWAQMFRFKCVGCPKC